MLTLYDQIQMKKWCYKMLVLEFVLAVVNFILFANNLGIGFYNIYYQQSVLWIVLGFIAASISAVGMAFAISGYNNIYDTLKEIEDGKR